MRQVPSRRALFYGGQSRWWAVAGQVVVAAYQPKGAASLAASYINLANPGAYTAAPGVAPTLDANGWVFNGSTQYLTTGITPDAAWTMIVRFSDAPSAGNNDLCGLFAASNSTRFYLRRSTTARGYGYGSQLEYAASGATSGVSALTTNGGYYNGVSDLDPAGTWTTAGTRKIYIGALNDDGGVSGFLNGKIQAFALYSTTLSASDVAALTIRMAAL